MKYLCSLVIMFALICCDVKKVESQIKKYYFNDYTVITGFCEQQSKIDILNKNNDTLYSYCFGDGFYSLVDTININNDNVSDVVYSYYFDTYYIVGFLLSDTVSPFFRRAEVEYEYYSPEFSDYMYKQNESHLELIVKDINNDHKDDVLVNLIDSAGYYKVVKNWTDTIFNNSVNSLFKR